MVSVPRLRHIQQYVVWVGRLLTGCSRMRERERGRERERERESIEKQLSFCFSVLYVHSVDCFVMLTGLEVDCGLDVLCNLRRNKRKMTIGPFFKVSVRIFCIITFDKGLSVCLFCFVFFFSRQGFRLTAIFSCWVIIIKKEKKEKEKNGSIPATLSLFQDSILVGCSDRCHFAASRRGWSRVEQIRDQYLLTHSTAAGLLWNNGKNNVGFVIIIIIGGNSSRKFAQYDRDCPVKRGVLPHDSTLATSRFVLVASLQRLESVGVSIDILPD